MARRVSGASFTRGVVLSAIAVGSGALGACAAASRPIAPQVTCSFEKGLVPLPSTLSAGTVCEQVRAVVEADLASSMPSTSAGDPSVQLTIKPMGRDSLTAAITVRSAGSSKVIEPVTVDVQDRGLNERDVAMLGRSISLVVQDALR